MKILLIQKKKLKKFEIDKLREECGIFGISNHVDASALVALGLHALQHRGKRAVESYPLMAQIIIQKRGRVWSVIILLILIR